MDMHAQLVLLPNLEEQFRLTGKNLARRLIFQLCNPANNPDYLPHYIAVSEKNPLNSDNLIAFTPLVVMQEIGEYVATIIPLKEGRREIIYGPPDPVIHCSNITCYMRPEQFARYEFAQNVLRPQ